VALEKSWDDLVKAGLPKDNIVKFLGQDYALDTKSRKVLFLSSGAAANDFSSIIILHYLAVAAGGLPPLERRWVSFKELAGVEGYTAAFRKRVIEPILRKYGNNPEKLLGVLEKLPGKKALEGDVGVVIEVFQSLPVLILLWRSDAEFGPEANMLFDESIKQIFCAEDIVVLAGMIAGAL